VVNTTGGPTGPGWRLIDQALMPTMSPATAAVM
jgi:hypothetical protein